MFREVKHTTSKRRMENTNSAKNLAPKMSQDYRGLKFIAGN
jgi:hypothetical protein